MTEKALLEVQPVVVSIAYKFFKQVPPSVTQDELEAAGWDGVLDFAPRYDPSRGVPFRLAVRHRINGSIQDYLRTLDPISRQERKLVKAGEKEPSVVLVHTDLSQSALVDPGSLTRILGIESAADLKKLWWGSGIRGRNKRIFRARVFQDRSTLDIARAFKIHESRVSQVVAWCLDRLRRRVAWFNQVSKLRCPCGAPLRSYGPDGVFRTRKKYCSSRCRVENLTAKVCCECSRPVWKQMVKDEYRPGKRRGRGTRCRFHYLVNKAREQMVRRRRNASPKRPRTFLRDEKGKFVPSPE